MSQPLSPAAQAVIKAIGSNSSGHAMHILIRGIAINAIRTVADQVLPARPQLDSCCEHWEQDIRHRLLSIVDELKALQ